MSNLENLTAKILADSEAQANAILEEARQQAARIVAEQEEVAQREKERILALAQTEAAHSQEQIVLGRTLSIRDENLAAKQQILDKVFSQALAKLNDMPKEEFFAFASKYLATLDLDGEEIYFPAKYAVTSLDELNTYLKKQGKKGNLVLGDSSKRTIDGGFLLAKNGIEENNTFAALIDYYRYELESEVLATLYQ